MSEVAVNECIRCRREAPEPASAEFLHWDPVSDDADWLICPDCLTCDEEVAAQNARQSTTMRA
jgi:hypothetical protein